MKDSNLPTHFIFSQGSLQAYVDCPRLFQLRYVERLLWPAPESEPSLENERYVQLGSSFHQLVQQYYLDIDPERLSLMAMRDPLLHQWWGNFIQLNPKTDGSKQYTEISLSTPLDQFRLVAKYDLLIIKKVPLLPKKDASINLSRDHDELNWKAIILDWKTSRKLPERQWQASRLQTRVYPYVLVKAGTTFLGNETIEPDQIKMVYWFSNYPTEPIHFYYSQEDFEKDEAFLSALINEIKTLDVDEAPKTQNQKRCRYCGYRSLCNRGIKAGSYLELDAEDRIQNEDLDLSIEFDFDQIAEIEF